jgi:hypothetical protein
VSHSLSTLPLESPSPTVKSCLYPVIYGSIGSRRKMQPLPRIRLIISTTCSVDLESTYPHVSLHLNLSVVHPLCLLDYWNTVSDYS